MLHDLSFLSVGQPWPPKREAERMERYEAARKLFDGAHGEVYREQFKRVERVIGNFNDVIRVEFVANYPRLISLKTADLLFGEAPGVSAGDTEDISAQESAQKVVESCGLWRVGHELAIDVSRFGTGLFYVYRDESGRGTISLARPDCWYPVVDPLNIKRALFHTLATRFSPDDETEYLGVEIHGKGTAERRTYLLEGGTISRLARGPETYKTGLDDFAVIPVHNIMTSDRATGADDYLDIDSALAELEVRIAQIARVLDKHAGPSMQGPESALELDETTGQYMVKAGNYFINGAGGLSDGKVEYLTWNAEMAAAFQQIDLIIGQIRTISQMGALLSDMTDHTWQAPSGTALRRMLAPALAKVSRIRMQFDPALKKAITMCSKLGGDGIADLTGKPLNIEWKDGLPDDPLEAANIANVRTGGKATQSQMSAIKTLDGVDDDDAQVELDLINADEERAAPPELAANVYPGRDGAGEAVSDE